MNNGGDRLGYIVMPMDLTERQALIYLQLYKKCNFQDMTVKYTREQLANDITITEIKPLTVYKEVTNMIKKGYLEVIKKGGKGNPTVYRIVPFIEIKNGTIKEQQQNNKRTIKYSKIKGCNGDTEQQRNNNRTIKEHPIKEKEKENNIYIDLTFIDDVIDRVKITQEQYKKLIDKYNKDLVNSQILALDNYITNGKGNKYKDHYRVLNTWCSKSKPKEKKVLTGMDLF